MNMEKYKKKETIKIASSFGICKTICSGSSFLLLGKRQRRSFKTPLSNFAMSEFSQLQLSNFNEVSSLYSSSFTYGS